MKSVSAVFIENRSKIHNTVTKKRQITFKAGGHSIPGTENLGSGLVIKPAVSTPSDS